MSLLGGHFNKNRQMDYGMHATGATTFSLWATCVYPFSASQGHVMGPIWQLGIVRKWWEVLLEVCPYLHAYLVGPGTLTTEVLFTYTRTHRHADTDTQTQTHTHTHTDTCTHTLMHTPPWCKAYTVLLRMILRKSKEQIGTPCMSITHSKLHTQIQC